jgi:dephospho-CoA kinase
VGAGKSHVARALAEALPATVLDADALVQDLLKSPQVLDSIEVALGFGVRDAAGELDRATLGSRVFGDPEARQTLEQVLHPAVRQRLWQQLDALEQVGGPVWAILDVPLLREGGLDQACDWVIHVDAPESLRCARACARHGWDAATWNAREAAQMPVDEKRRRADAILDNDAEAEDLSRRIEALLPRLRALPPRPLRARWPAPDAGPSRHSTS